MVPEISVGSALLIIELNAAAIAAVVLVSVLFMRLYLKLNLCGSRIHERLGFFNDRSFRFRVVASLALQSYRDQFSLENCSNCR